MVKSMDTIVNLCKARGYIYPGSEIYGGLSNTWAKVSLRSLNGFKRNFFINMNSIKIISLKSTMNPFILTALR